MTKFIAWYFPIKLLLTICFVLAQGFGTALFGLFVVVDLFVVPIICTIFFTFRKRKLRAGEYTIKPKGSAL